MTSILLHFLLIFSLAPVLISQLLCEKDYVVYPAANEKPRPWPIRGWETKSCPQALKWEPIAAWGQRPLLG